MKQGQAQSSHMGSTKTEPRSRAVNVEHVADIGIQSVKHVNIPMYEGRGLEAPHTETTIHNHGSQGRHK